MPDESTVDCLRSVVLCGGRITAEVDGDVLEFELAHRSGCLSDADAWCSAVESLRAWCAALLDLALLRRHGLPVWCARHRAGRSPVPCGRFDHRQPG